MSSDQKGMTLVEVLATLVLISLVTTVIWTTISIANKFNIGETSTLRLQQEANYIIAELQTVQRACKEYKLTIAIDRVLIRDCIPFENQANNIIADKVISDNFYYKAIISSDRNKKFEDGEDITEIIDHPVKTFKSDLVLYHFFIQDKKFTNRKVDIPTTLTRYKTD